MEIFIKAAQLILSLSILVFFHEFGHYLFARLFGVKVQKVSLFLDPWFSVFRIRRKNVEFRIGWLPLGGYIQLAGIHKAVNQTTTKNQARLYEFQNKPAWQRLLIILGGVLMNFLLAIVIFVGLLVQYGEKYLPANEARYGIVCDSLAKEAGLKHGDIIVGINNKPVERFGRIFNKIVLREADSIQVIRDDAVKNIKIHDTIIGEMINNKAYMKNQHFISPGIPFIIKSIAKGSAADSAQLQAGDRIIRINSMKYPYYNTCKQTMHNNRGSYVALTIARGTRQVETKLFIPKNGNTGITTKSSTEIYRFASKSYRISEAIPAGLLMGYRETSNYIKQIKLLFHTETKAYKSLGGLISIGRLFPDYWDWYWFWVFTALFSLITGVINLIPIPLLDGGYALLIFIEMISGRQPKEKILHYARITGLIVLISLLVFANGNDIFRYMIQ